MTLPCRYLIPRRDAISRTVSTISMNGETMMEGRTRIVSSSNPPNHAFSSSTAVTSFP